VGNRLTDSNTGQITYTYDANNKLTQLVAPGGTTTFGYDNNGNTTSMVNPGPVTTSYGYDYENRLTSVSNPSYTAAYTYSADGLRLRAQESNHAYQDRWFQYDGVRPVMEGTLSGNTFTTRNRYVWEGNSYYDPLISAHINGDCRYYLYDGLGSTRQLLDLSQNVTDTYTYEAFGNLVGSTGSTANPYRYVGSLGYYQTGSSLMHLGARYYMPEVGGFVQADPIRRPSLTSYAYCADMPTAVVDPTGENPWLVAWAAWKLGWQIGCGAITLYAAYQTAQCLERMYEFNQRVNYLCDTYQMPLSYCIREQNEGKRMEDAIGQCGSILCAAGETCAGTIFNFIWGKIFKLP